MPTSLPQIFGRYTLIQRIGEGGMAEVYLAEAGVAEGLKKRVVIKKIRSDVADQPEFMRMFVAEAEIALGLNHANIVQVFDFGRVEGAFYLAMELVEGVDLMRLVRLVAARDERVPVVIAAYVAHQVAAGLAYAHAKRDDFGRPLAIVHSDISPHNIMLSLAGTVKILDFGIARTAARARRCDDDGTIQGKIAYMSPEQAHGRALDARSDIYSLGVVLHELLTGELVFRDSDRMIALEQVRTRPLPPLRRAAPHVPDELAAVVDRALAREPVDRWDTARALQGALAAFLHRADPVVDDEVLSAFVATHVPDELFSRPHGDADVTRELEGSLSQLAASARLDVRRVVLLKAALAPAPGDDAPREPAGFGALARDIAYKRDAQVCELGPRGLLLAFGTVLDPGDVDDAALRAALALREAAGEAAPGFQIGVVLAAAPLPIRDVPGGAPTVEVGHDLRRHLQAMAAGVLDGPVLVAGDLVGRLGSTWHFGQPRTFDLDRPRRALEVSGGVLPPWAAALAHAAPLLGPIAESRPLPSGSRVPLLGRELELKLLRDGFAEAIRTRTARAVLIVGGPGIGKRALVNRFLAALPRGGCVVLRGRGQWRRRNVPLGVFVEMLRQFFDVGPDTTARDLESRLVAERVVGAGELAETLARALGVPLTRDTGPEGHVQEDSEQLDPQARRDRLWRLIRRLIRALAQRRPVLVAVEDLHHVDEHSVTLLREWLQTPHDLPLMGVTTARPGPRADELRALPRVQALDLRELDEHARRELIVRRFEDPADAEELAGAIVARTGGNPLFIEETLADLLRRGVVGPGDEGRLWRVHQRGARIEVPPSVEDALHARLDALPPEQRALVDGAAVLGLTFRTGELAALLGRSDAELADPLAALVEAGLLERPPLPAGAPPAARFATLALHEVARANLSSGTAESAHARAAELKAGRPDYHPGRDDGPIADHWSQARRPEAAIDPALRAARFARDVAGNVEAYYYLSLALRSLGPDTTDPRAWDALREREAILGAWGRRRAQGADLRELLRLALGDPEREVVALGRLLRFYVDCGRIQRAEQLFPRLTRQTEALPDDGPHRAALGELGSALMLARGRPDEAERLAAAGLARCPPEAAAQRCRLHAALGRAQLAEGRLAEAAANFEATLHLAQKTGLLRLEGEALNSLGEVAGRSTRYQAAVDYFRAALQVDRDLGDRAATGTKLANLGIVYTAIGLYRRAERYLRKALELHEAIGHPGLLIEVIVNLGEVSAEHGDVQGARALLLQAADMAATRGDARTELRARALLARALVGGGPDHHDEARALAEGVLTRARALGLRTATCRALHVLSRLSEQSGDLEAARALEEEAVALVRAGAAPIDGVLSIHHLGRLLAAARPAESAALLDEAAAAVRARLEGLRDEELRRGYLAQAKVREILAEGPSA